MRTKSNKVLVSVYRSSLSNEVNHANHNKAIELLNREKVSFQVVNGVYKNGHELTFLLASDSVQGHEHNLYVANSLALLFNQESILEVHNDDIAFLKYTNGVHKRLGVFQEVDQTNALKLDSYTFEPVSSRFFAVI